MTTIAQERDGSKLKPVYAADIELLNSGGTFRIADRQIVTGGNRYESYMIDVAALSAQLDSLTSAGNNVNLAVTLSNARYRAYDYLSQIEDDHPLTGAQITLYELYLDLWGGLSEPVTLYVGVIDKVENITDRQFTLSLSDIEYHKNLKWEAYYAEL